MKATLLLENGSTFIGESFGAHGEATGEVVFNTSMSGYQEILTDPSYAGQIVTMTYPLIGNYGTNGEDVESKNPWVSGFLVREYSEIFSNWRSDTSLHDYLMKHNVIALQGIDTRMLTKIIRSAGAMRAIISTEDDDEKKLLEKVKASPDMTGRDLARVVTTPESYRWNHSVEDADVKKKFRVVVFDFGVKHNIMRLLAKHGCELTIVPANYSAEETLALEPDGIFLSNGPGDPSAVTYAIETIKKLSRSKPIFGICLGHQLLSLAFGARTYKLKFGHRGANHPVMNLRTKAIEITSQNHGFAVDAASLPSALELTHVNLNDQTVEGFRHRELPIFCVQYHPEASPGPHDSEYLFSEFIENMRRG